MIFISPTLTIPDSDIELSFIRAPGPGGQNVNKVATAVQLRFNITTSSALSDEIRARLLFVLKNKITTQGEIIIKANRYRTQERNKHDAIQRLQTLLQHAAKLPKKRKKTQPTFAARERRLQQKKIQGKIKSLRQKKVNDY